MKNHKFSLVLLAAIFITVLASATIPHFTVLAQGVCGIPGTPPCPPPSGSGGGGGGGGGNQNPTPTSYPTPKPKPTATSTQTPTSTPNAIQTFTAETLTAAPTQPSDPVLLTAQACWYIANGITPGPSHPTPSWGDIQGDSPQCMPTATPSVTPTPFFIPPVAGPQFLPPGVINIIAVLIIIVCFIGGILFIRSRFMGDGSVKVGLNPQPQPPKTGDGSNQFFKIFDNANQSLKIEDGSNQFMKMDKDPGPTGTNSTELDGKINKLGGSGGKQP